MNDNRYNNRELIPHHMFKDRMLRVPASKELHTYLQWMLVNCPDDLDYLYQESQKYVDHGGGWKESFKQWKDKLKISLEKLQGTYE